MGSSALRTRGNLASTSKAMTYVTAEARQELLDTIAEAASELASALASLGVAYEQLDDCVG